MKLKKEIESAHSYVNSDEKLPKSFQVNFFETCREGRERVLVRFNGVQIGDVIDDNSFENDYYRYHDVFHFTFATFLGWSPCTRAMLKKKRKSNPLIDEFEDGARATITEEAISLMLFNQSKKYGDFSDPELINSLLIDLIKDMTEPFEVRSRTRDEWVQAISTGYKLFDKLKTNKGGTIRFNGNTRQATYVS